MLHGSSLTVQTADPLFVCCHAAAELAELPASFTRLSARL